MLTYLSIDFYGLFESDIEMASVEGEGDNRHNGYFTEINSNLYKQFECCFLYLKEGNLQSGD
jgi:hypothetical protein